MFTTSNNNDYNVYYNVLIIVSEFIITRLHDSFLVDTCRHSIRIQRTPRTYCVFLRVLYSSQIMRIVFLGVVALTVLPWSNAECPSSLSPNVICQPQEDIGVCIRSHLEFGGNGCISIHLSEGTYYLSERFEVVNRSVSITSTELVLIACNFSSTFSRSPVFSVKEAEFAELKGVNFSSCSNTVEFVSVRTVKIIGATFE